MPFDSEMIMNPLNNKYIYNGKYCLNKYFFILRVLALLEKGPCEIMDVISVPAVYALLTAENVLHQRNQLNQFA